MHYYNVKPVILQLQLVASSLFDEHVQYLYVNQQKKCQIHVDRRNLKYHLMEILK